MSLLSEKHDFLFHAASSEMRRHGATFHEPRVEVSLILEGEVTFIVDGLARTVAAPAASFQAYRRSLQVVTPKGGRTRTMWCYASSSLLDDCEWALADRLPVSIEISGALRMLFDSALSVPADATLQPVTAHGFDRNMRNAFGAAIFAEYFRCAGRKTTQDMPPPLPVRKARTTMDERYTAPWEVKDLAKIAGVNPNYLIHIFKKHIGVSPIRYLWNRRMEMGVHLLRTTDLSVEEIAFRSGFQTAAHFSRMVKREKGHPPARLRHATPWATSWASSLS